MASIELTIGTQKYVLRGDETDEHLREVAELVRRKIDALRKKSPSLSLQKASMLAAFDFASQMIKGRKKALDYRSELVAKASQLLQKVESELAGSSSLKLSQST